jgi:predicted amidohydrolase YtcJ
VIAARAWLLVALVGLTVLAGCAPNATTSASPPPSGAATEPSAVASAPSTRTGSLVVVGRIVTMDEPPIAEALLIEDGRVTAVGPRDEVLALARDQVPVLDIGPNVAYPGFIDAHAHWIGDREYYDVASAEDAMAEAVSRGWTSISEQWVNPERLDELESLAADDALPLRVDAYLALNFGDDFLGDWYVSREPGAVDDHLRVQGLKVHLDNGDGTVLLWEPADVTETIGRANEAGWQVSVHTVSTAAHEMVLDAYEAALGPTGPNPLHHRIDHAIQVSDDQLARMVAMDLATVIHLDGTAVDWVLWSEYLGHLSPGNLEGGTAWLTRWHDFVDAGLHVAAGSDTPWFLHEFDLTDDISRPVDQIAGGMDGRGREYPETPAWVLDQLLTAEQGLRAVTLDAAWALGEEARRGHLAPGTLGDVTILSGDVTAATPDEIRAMTVIATIVGGIPAYCADPEICSRP